MFSSWRLRALCQSAVARPYDRRTETHFWFIRRAPYLGVREAFRRNPLLATTLTENVFNQ
jgi:hypothetical protein